MGGVGGGLPRGDVHHNLFSVIMLNNANRERGIPVWRMLLYSLGVFAAMGLLLAAIFLLGPLLGKGGG